MSVLFSQKMFFWHVIGLNKLRHCWDILKKKPKHLRPLKLSLLFPSNVARIQFWKCFEYKSCFPQWPHPFILFIHSLHSSCNVMIHWIFRSKREISEIKSSLILPTQTNHCPSFVVKSCHLLVKANGQVGSFCVKKLLINWKWQIANFVYMPPTSSANNEIFVCTLAVQMQLLV